MFSVDTEEEAQQLLIIACPRNYDGEFVARELVKEQTLENLFSFGSKLEKIYKTMKARRKAQGGP